MAKLIVTLMILAPAIALAGNAGDDYQYEQNTAPKVVVNVPAADNANGAIIAAIVAGAFSLAGIMVLRNKKS